MKRMTGPVITLVTLPLLLLLLLLSRAGRAKGVHQHATKWTAGLHMRQRLLDDCVRISSHLSTVIADAADAADAVDAAAAGGRHVARTQQG
jgi:hypothetical protein